MTHIQRALGLLVLLATASPTWSQQFQPGQTPPDFPGIQRAVFHGHTDRIRCVAIANDGRTIASGGIDRTVRIWDTVTGMQQHVLQHTGTVNCLAFSADGKKLAAGDADMLVLLWDVGTGRKLATLTGIAGQVYQVTFTGDGKTLAASGTRSAKMWDAETGREKFTFAGRFALSSDGKTLAMSRADGSIQLWDVTTDKALFTLIGHKGNVVALAFAPDGKTFASGAYGGGLDGGDGEDKSIKLWDVATGKERATLLGHVKGIHSLTFSPDGKTFVATDYHGSMKLWDVDQARVKATLEKVKIGDRITGAPFGVWAIAPDLRTWAVGAGQEVRWLDIADFTGARK